MSPLSKRGQTPNRGGLKYSRGLWVSSPLASLKCIPCGEGITEIKILTPKAVFKKAVDRNRARRRVRAAFKTRVHDLRKGYSLVISLRERAVLTLPFCELQTHLDTLLRRGRLL